MIVGDFGEIIIRLSVPPNNSVNSSFTILMTVCAGFKEPNTSSPKALSLIRAMKSFATPKFTSASNKANRTCRNARLTSSSEILPFPFKDAKASCNLCVKFSKAILALQLC